MRFSINSITRSKSVALGIFIALSFIKVNAQTFNYTKNALNVDVTVSNPCGGSTSNGFITFKVNGSNGGSATLTFVQGPNGFLSSPVTINNGNTFVYTDPGPDQAGSYDFIIHDASNSINTFSSGVQVHMVDLATVVINQVSLTNNSSCVTPNGDVVASISGGSKSPALTVPGSFTYTWTANNGAAGLPLTNNSFDGTSNLDLSALLGHGLAGGIYTLTILDNYSACAAIVQNFTITDPSPTAFTVSTSTPSICVGASGTVNLSNSESAAVTYEVYEGGVATGINLPGSNSALAFTIPAVDLTPAGTYNFTIRAVNGSCTPVFMTGTASIIVSPNNTVTAASSTPTLCVNTALTPITFTTTGATGIGAPTGLPAGVTASWASNTITVSGTPTASGVFSYSIPLTGGCGSINATGTITVTAGNTVTAASSNPTLCINTVLTPITFTTTGATGIGAPTGLPAGVTAAWASNTITVSGTPTAAGIFSYSIPLTGGCGVVNATGTITVTAANTVTAASSIPTLCVNTALTPITFTTTGATGIGAPTGLPAGVTAAWAANTITVSGTPTASGVFSYTIPLTGGCSIVNATGTITVTPGNTVSAASSSPSLCINTALTPITFTTTGATGIGAPTGLPAGVTAAWAANKITVSGTPTASGVFSYSIPLTGGCGSVNATGTITVNINTITLSSAVGTDNQTVCINTAILNITYATTGATGATFTGLPTGVTGNWASNVATISGTPTVSGPFSYTVKLTGGCGVVTATGTITVTPANTVTAASSTPTLCINTALTPITFTTTGATGIGAPTGLPAGVTAAWAANTITVSGTPTASGVFSYSIPLTGGCGIINATGTITVTAANTVSAASSTPTLCINTALTPITFTTTGATGIGAPTGLPAGVTAVFAANKITVSGTPTVAGVFSYSIPLTGGCGSVNATGTITVTAANTVTAASSNPTLCVNTALTAITFTTTGATGIGAPIGLPSGVTAAWAANTITVSGTPTASGVFSYTIPLTGGCGSVNATGTITVSAGNTVTAASSNPTLCINTALTPITFTTTGATGIGAATGLPAGVTAAWASNTITVSGTPTASGVFSYSIPLTGGCGSVNATGTITVNSNNTIALSSPVGTDSQTACINTAITNITYATTGATGATFTGLPAGVTGSWASNVATISGTPTAAGPFSYTVTLTGGCGSVNATGTITVSSANTVTAASSNPTLCINTALTPITFTTTGATGIGAPTGLPAGVTAAWAASTITVSGTPTASGVFNYSIPLTGGCGSVNATGTITVSINTIALSSAAGTDSQTPCINTAITNITYATTGATGATFSGLPAGVTGSWAANVATISGTPTVSGPFSYTVTLTGGCGSVNATGTITVTTANTITLSSPAGTDSQTPCINTAITNITYATTGATGATFSGLPAGVTGSWALNVATISGTPTVTGPFSYTVTLTGGCGSINATGTITVGANNTITLSSAAGTDNQTLCVNTAIINITYATTGATGATFSGLPAGVTGSWASNVATISGTPTVAGPFSYTVTPTGGCGSVNATGAITATAANTIALSSAAGTDSQTPCINAAIITITYATTGATGATFSGLPAGVTGSWASNIATISGTPTAAGPFSYTVTLTGGCGSINATGTITVNALPTTSAITGTTPVCVNTLGVAYSVTTTVGSTYAWTITGGSQSGGTNTSSITVDWGATAGPGNVSVTETNAAGCLGSPVNFAVVINGATTSAITGNNTICANTTGVSYDVTNTAGSTYAWTITGGVQSGGTNTNSITVDWGSAGPGNVSVTETTGGSCVGSPVNLAVTINAVPSISSIATTDATCLGLNDGLIQVNGISGGSAPYQYSIDAGTTFQFSNTFSNVAPNTYQVVVKDKNGCVSPALAAIINAGTTITETTSAVNASCVGTSNGSITVTTVTGGTAPYTYSDDNGTTFQLSNNFAGLSVNTYQVIAKDNNGCQTTPASVSVGSNTTITFTATPTNASCSGVNDGTIVISGETGGTGPYTYSDDNGTTFQGSATFSNLTPATYSIIIKDSNGCSSAASATVVGSSTTVSITTVNHTDATCLGLNDGTITVSAVSGGTSPYSYSVDTGTTYQGGTSFSGLSPNTYQVVVKDNNGCTSTPSSVIVGSGSTITITTSKIDASCGGNSDGSITVTTVTGGNPVYTYSSDGGTTFQGSNVLSNLAAGPYSVVVKDNGGCLSTPVSVTINNSVSITPNFTKTDASCAGNDGSIVINTVSGGTGPYQYSITGAAPYQVSSTFSNLGVATYSLIVKDNNGCLSTPISIVVSKPPVCGGTNCGAFTILATDTRPTCSGQDDGTITVNVTGGSPNYIVTLNDASQSFSQGLAGPGPFNFINLSPSLNYQYTIQDAVGNTCTLPYSLPIQTNVQATASGFVDAICFNQAVGQATVTVTSGGTSPYQYSLDAGTTWITFTSPVTITNLMPAPSPYSILVRDDPSDLCPAQVMVTINNSVTAITTTLTEADASCANNDGSFQVGTVSGGTAPYTYRMDSVAYAALPSSNTFTGLAGGTHTFTVIDANGCSKYFKVIVNFPGLVNFTTSFTNPSCLGNGNDGSVTATISSSGTFDVGITTDPVNDPTTFQTVVSAGASQVVFSGLSQGVYYVVAKPSGALCPSRSLGISINGGPVAVDFNFKTGNFTCFETKGVVQVFAITGSNALDYSYEIIQSGNVVQSGTITHLQSLPPDTLSYTGLETGNYQIHLFQDQSLLSGCTAPISSAYKPFSISGPTASLDTLFVLRKPSLPNLPSGAIQVGIQQSLNNTDPYHVMLHLVTPLVPNQKNKAAFDSTWVSVTLNGQTPPIVEFDANNIYGGTYQLSIKDTLGCTRVYSIDLNGSDDLFIPNVFTPNKDGKNDNFEILNLPDDNNIVITNRWGKEVFHASNLKPDPFSKVTVVWSGGAESDGVYFYKLNAGGKTYTGWVEILHPTF